MEDIAPCPWCKSDGRPFPHRKGVKFTVRCHKCSAQGPEFDIGAGPSDKGWDFNYNRARTRAIKHWNKLHKLIRKSKK